MKKYELVLIADPKLNKNQVVELEEETKNKIKQYGKIINMQDKGIKKLAYEIKKNQEGHYYFYQFEVENRNNNIAIPEIERFCRLTDKIIKFMTVAS